MTNGLIFEGALLEELIRQVEPNREESCGFLVGHEHGHERRISGIIPATNVAHNDRERQFLIAASEYIHAESTASENGLLLLGIYHSHPDHPAMPSERDRIAAQPFFSYVIVSLKGQQFEAVRSWRLNQEGHFDEELITN